MTAGGDPSSGGRPGVTTYDDIGPGYATLRRPDPRIEALVLGALGPAGRVVNVGAGAGSYEPADRAVVAVEPSAVMATQRRPGAGLVVRAAAEELPFAKRSFDAALAVLTVHHWDDPAAGLFELRRVARRQVVLSFEPEVHLGFWLIEEYLPEIADLPGSHPPTPAEIARLLGGGRVTVVPVPADCADAFLWAHWRRPDAYLDPAVGAANSGMSLIDPGACRRGLGRLARDLESGRWLARHRELLSLGEVDGGFRLVVADGAVGAQGS